MQPGRSAGRQICKPWGNSPRAVAQQMRRSVLPDDAELAPQSVPLPSAGTDIACPSAVPAPHRQPEQFNIPKIQAGVEIMAARKSSRTRKASPDGNELLVLELQEIHSAESQLSRTLPKLMKSVESEELRGCLEERLSQGERLTREVESALEEMEESPGRKKNVAAEGLINDAREHVQELESGPALDAVLIGAIQKTEHYCIAAWGTARSLGNSAGQKEVVSSMERALEEGKQMDEKLTVLAEQKINPQVFAAESAEQDEVTDEAGEEESSGGRSGRRGNQGRQEQRTSR